MKRRIAVSMLALMIAVCLLLSACGNPNGLTQKQKDNLNQIMGERMAEIAEETQAEETAAEAETDAAVEKATEAAKKSAESVQATAMAVSVESQTEPTSALDDDQVYSYVDEETGVTVYYWYWDVIEDYLYWFYIDGYSEPIFFFYDYANEDFIYFIIDEESGEFVFLNLDEEEPEEEKTTVEEPCYMCNGTGVEPCAFCLGKGYLTSPSIVCGFCGGSKTQVCHTCNGEKVLVRNVSEDPVSENAGWVTDDNGDAMFEEGTPCVRCEGSGIISCYSCHGSGTVPKTTYTPKFGNGSGGSDTAETTCRICHGTGTVTCTLCFGTGVN